MEPIRIEGRVDAGRRLGRTLGFPTANIAVGPDLTAADGVYRARITVDGRPYDALSNLGTNPTVGGSERRLESHLLGFRGALYGRTVCVELLERIRDERTFASLDELRAQLRQDRAEVLRRAAAEPR